MNLPIQAMVGAVHLGYHGNQGGAGSRAGGGREIIVGGGRGRVGQGRIMGRE